MGSSGTGMVMVIVTAPLATTFCLSSISQAMQESPKALYDKFLYAKFMSDISSTGLLQKFVMNFMKSGESKNISKRLTH